MTHFDGAVIFVNQACLFVDNIMQDKADNSHLLPTHYTSL
jgi:hypothetical protein